MPESVCSESGSVHGVGTKNSRSLPWHRYVPKGQVLDSCYDHPFTILRAQERKTSSYVGIELIPRRFALENLFPLKSSALIERLCLCHPSLCEIKDVFYSPDLQCLCFVHDIPNHGRTLRQFFDQSNRVNIKVDFDSKQIRMIFRQIVQGIQFLCHEGVQINHISMDDILIWQDSLGNFHAQLLFLKFLEAQELAAQNNHPYSLLNPPEQVFPELRKNHHSEEINDEAANDSKRIAWQLGLVLYQICLGQELPDFIDSKDEYLDQVDEIVNQISGPCEQWKCASIQDVIQTLLDVEIQCRSSFQDLCEHLWVAFGPEAQAECHKSPDFVALVRKQLTHCLLDNNISKSDLGHSVRNGNIHRLGKSPKLHGCSDGVAQSLNELIKLSYQEYANEARSMQVPDGYHPTPRSSVDCSPLCMSRRSSGSLCSTYVGSTPSLCPHNLYKPNASPMTTSLMSMDSYLKDPSLQQQSVSKATHEEADGDNSRRQSLDFDGQVLERHNSMNKFFKKIGDWILHHGHAAH
eukprot:TRINITY_DN3539_c0_g1_i1.p1 TRINITY_DN3539_c0_g1~~TRINITY_DN3539_c0_g1_i1.p1  ORF type:complete len:521 (+),score=42.08 TRINITY_DN3539_c0_g1_i1:365-1927(+)